MDLQLYFGADEVSYPRRQAGGDAHGSVSGVMAATLTLYDIAVAADAGEFGGWTSMRRTRTRVRTLQPQASGGAHGSIAGVYCVADRQRRRMLVLVMADSPPYPLPDATSLCRPRTRLHTVSTAGFWWRSGLGDWYALLSSSPMVALVMVGGHFSICQMQR